MKTGSLQTHNHWLLIHTDKYFVSIYQQPNRLKIAGEVVNSGKYNNQPPALTGRTTRALSKGGQHGEYLHWRQPGMVVAADR